MFRLCWKKLKGEWSQSLVMVCCMILICIVILVLGNIGYYMYKNIQVFTLQNASEYGLEFSVRLSGRPDEFRYIDATHAEAVIKQMEDRYGKFRYSARFRFLDVELQGDVIQTEPYFARGMQQEFVLIQGDPLAMDADGQNSIWIGEQISAQVGDTITLTVEGKEQTFLVRGKVQGEKSYIDYRHFQIKTLTGIQDWSDRSFGQLMQFRRYVDRVSEQLQLDTRYGDAMCVDTGSTAVYDFLHPLYLVVGLVVALIGIATALAVGGMVYAVRLRAEADCRTFGILRALGLKRRGIVWYYLAMWSSFVLAAVIVACIVSAILLHVAMGSILQQFFVLAGYYSPDLLTGFYWVFPLACVGWMGILCGAIAVRESYRIARQDVTELLRERV